MPKNLYRKIGVLIENLDVATGTSPSKSPLKLYKTNKNK